MMTEGEAEKLIPKSCPRRNASSWYMTQAEVLSLVHKAAAFERAKLIKYLEEQMGVMSASSTPYIPADSRCGEMQCAIDMLTDYGLCDAEPGPPLDQRTCEAIAEQFDTQAINSTHDESYHTAGYANWASRHVRDMAKKAKYNE